MDAPAREIAAILAGAGLGVLGAASGWGVYAFREPDEPETVVTVYDTGGTDSVNEPDTGVIQPTIQIRTRALLYDSAYAKQLSARDALMLSPVSVAITDGFIVGVWPTSGILPLGPDEKGRHRLVSNYRLTIERS